MNKTKIASALVLASLIALPVISLAISTSTPPSETAVANLTNLIDKIKTIVWMFFGVIAVIAFVVAGILFLTAGGQPEKVQTARGAFIWGVVGVVVGIVAYSIIAIVGGGLGV